MNPAKQEVRSFADGDAYFWVEQNAVLKLKAASTFDEPIELTKEEAIEFAQALLEAAEQID